MEQQSLVLATASPSQTKMPKSEANPSVNQEPKQSFSSQLDKLTEESTAAESAKASNAKSQESKVTAKNEHVKSSSGNKLPDDDVEKTAQVSNVDEGSEEKLITSDVKPAPDLADAEKVKLSSPENGINVLVTQDEETPTELVKSFKSSDTKSSVESPADSDISEQKSQQNLKSKSETGVKSSAQLNTDVENGKSSELKSNVLKDSPKAGVSKQGENASSTVVSKAEDVVNRLESDKLTSAKNVVLEKDNVTSQQKIQANDVVQYKTGGNDGVKLTPTSNTPTDKVVIAKPEHSEPEFNLQKRPVVAQEITTQSKDVTKNLDSIAVESSAGLRSDILHALSRRGISKSQNNSGDTPINKDLSSSPIPVASKELMTEKTLLAQSVTQDITEKLISKPLSHTLERREVASPLTTLNSLSASSPAATVVKTDVPVFDIQPSMQSAAWNRVLSGRVMWMAKEGVQEASLKLNPAHLGPIEVKLQVHHEQANVSFIAQNAATRDALEQALPRLRDSFNQNGLELANADISHQSDNQEDLERQAQEAEQNKGSFNSQQESDDGELDNILVSGQQAEQVGVSVYA